MVGQKRPNKPSSDEPVPVADNSPHRRRPSSRFSWNKTPEVQNTEWFYTSVLCTVTAVGLLLFTMVLESMDPMESNSKALVVVGAQKRRITEIIASGLGKVRFAIINVVSPVVQRIPSIGGPRPMSTTVVVRPTGISSMFSVMSRENSFLYTLLIIAVLCGACTIAITAFANIDTAMKKTKK